MGKRTVREKDGMGTRDEMDGHSLRQQLRQAWRGRQVREQQRQFIKAHNHHYHLLPAKPCLEGRKFVSLTTAIG